MVVTSVTTATLPVAVATATLLVAVTVIGTPLCGKDMQTVNPSERSVSMSSASNTETEEQL
jgi:hypothetical protein